MVIGLSIWGFATNQYAMSFVIILLAWIYMYTENNTEDEIEVFITDLWVKVGEAFYEYKKIQNFNLIYDWDTASILRLKLKTKGVWVLDLDINNELASGISEVLPNFVEESENIEVTFVEKLIKFLNL